MTEDEILADFVRVEGRHVMVGTISWPHPSTPEMIWEPVIELADGLASEEVASLKRSLLADRRYFDRCARCGELKPLGGMHEPGLCQGCAQQHLGVVY